MNELNMVAAVPCLLRASHCNNDICLGLDNRAYLNPKLAATMHWAINAYGIEV